MRKLITLGLASVMMLGSSLVLATSTSGGTPIYMNNLAKVKSTPTPKAVRKSPMQFHLNPN